MKKNKTPETGLNGAVDDAKTNKSKRLPLSRRFFVYFVLFAAVILLLMWLFQSVFLDKFYRSVKLHKSETAVSQIAASLQSDSTDYDAIASIGSYYGACITVYGENLAPLYLYEAQPLCIIHNLSRLEELKYYSLAVSGEGSYSKIVNYVIQQPAFRGDSVYDQRASILTVRLLTGSNGEQLTVFFNMELTPVSSVVETLNLSLVVISAIVLAMALLLAIFVSRRFARPLVSLNASARQLAKGDYSVEFDTSSHYTEIAQLGESLNYASHELSKVDQLKTELIGNVSHDLRTPLTLIGGYAEVMRDIPGENTPENAQIIVDESRRLSTIVTDVLDLSKLDSGSDQLNSSVFSLTDSIASILKSYRALMLQEKYEIIFDNPCGDVLVRADDVKISRVIYNLLNNAVKFTGEDKKVRVSLRCDDKTARVSVSDTGAGIPQAELSRIFERYYKVKSDGYKTSARSGSGLGLSIVKAVLDLHSAPYGISSGNSGTTFWFELPMAEADDDVQ